MEDIKQEPELVAHTDNPFLQPKPSIKAKVLYRATIIGTILIVVLLFYGLFVRGFPSAEKVLTLAPLPTASAPKNAAVLSKDKHVANAPADWKTFTAQDKGVRYEISYPPAYTFTGQSPSDFQIRKTGSPSGSISLQTEGYEDASIGGTLTEKRAYDRAISFVCGFSGPTGGTTCEKILLQKQATTKSGIPFYEFTFHRVTTFSIPGKKTTSTHDTTTPVIIFDTGTLSDHAVQDVVLSSINTATDQMTTDIEAIAQTFTMKK